MIAGVHHRRSGLWEIAAWVTSHLLNASGKVMKKRITPDKLLGRSKTKTHIDKTLDFEEILRRQAALDAEGELDG